MRHDHARCKSRAEGGIRRAGLVPAGNVTRALAVARRQRARRGRILPLPLHIIRRVIECSPSVVRSHDHMCLIYGDPEELLSVVLPLFHEGLSARERCVWVLDDLPIEIARRALKGAGVDVARHVNDGSLVMWGRPEWRPPTLRPEQRLAEVRALVERAVADGHPGIRFAIDMTWTLDPDIPADQLETWEARLDSLFDGSLPVRMICHYSQRRLGPDAVQAGLRTHPRVALEGQVCDNPFYVAAPPAARQANGHGPPAHRPATAWMLRQLHASVAEQTELKSARRSLGMQLAVARVLADATSLELAAPRLLSAICAGGGWDAGALWTVGDRTDATRCVHAYATPAMDASRFVAATRAAEFGPGVGVAGRVVRRGAAVWIDDVSGDPTLPRAALAMQEGLRAGAAFPIRGAGRVIGVLEFFGHALRERDDALLADLDVVSSQIGQFLERRRAEERLRASEARLLESCERLEERVAERTADLALRNDQLVAFSYSASHDLLRPVRAIRGFADALLEDCRAGLGEVGVGHVARIVQAAGQMDRLIRGLLSYSHMNLAELMRDPVDVDAVIRDALAQLAPEVEATGARVSVVGRRGTVVHGHHGTLEQVISNLVANALKFVPAGVAPEVEIRIEEEDGLVRARITDNGIGIEPQHHDRIFELFERLHPDHEYPGTGIGLALVRRAMERMGGGVGVLGVPGGGSCFWLELPARSARAAAPALDRGTQAPAVERAATSAAGG